MQDGGGVGSQLPRFGDLREVPPVEVLKKLMCAASGSGWTATRVGGDGGYPNGGIWRVSADERTSDTCAAVVVKRTGAAYMGTSAVWRHRVGPVDPQWWGREAEFYLCDLATTGWTADVRTPWCHVDDHDGCRDLWLEEVDGIPATLDVCRRAVVGLAHWQMAHGQATHLWLCRDWIGTHVQRQASDNRHTLAHTGWSAAVERGLNPALRDWVSGRVTDRAEINRILAEFPHILTHHDFHAHNVGNIDSQVALIDWAYVGLGPIGHDAGHLALSLADDEAVEFSTVWQLLEDAYCDGRTAAGWTGDLTVVRRSMLVSNQLRMGWFLDHLLNDAPQLPDTALAAASKTLSFLYDLT